MIRRSVLAARRQNEQIAERQRKQAEALRQSAATTQTVTRVPASSKPYVQGTAMPRSNATIPKDEPSMPLPSKSYVPRGPKNAPSHDMYTSEMKKGSGGYIKGGTSIRDDRSNDWLAKQMKEERIALYRMGYMFGFKPGVSTISAAAANREFHEANCTSEGIDTAAGR